MFKIKSDKYDVTSTEIDAKAGEDLAFEKREDAEKALESLKAFFPHIKWYIVDENYNKFH